MIDTGPPRSEQAIEDWLRVIGIRPDEIQLIILTHGHADHVGSALGVKQLTGAKIAIHEYEKYAFENGIFVFPSAVTAWGYIVRTALTPLIGMFRLPETPVDVVLRDEGLSLVEYGIQGRVIHTPGHTPGSVSVLLDTGDAFVGCLAHNNMPFRLSPGLPIFAEDLSKVKESWSLLFEKGAKNIYPAHGEPFSVEVIHKALS